MIRAIRIEKIFMYERMDRIRVHGSEGPAMSRAKPGSDRERSYPEESEEENMETQSWQRGACKSPGVARLVFEEE